jgi:hypothetical protein
MASKSLLLLLPSLQPTVNYSVGGGTRNKSKKNKERKGKQSILLVYKEHLPLIAPTEALSKDGQKAKTFPT